MTPREAEQLTDRLIAAFPRHDWADSTIDLYARILERVEHPHGAHAVDRAVTTLDLAPTVRWLLDTAHAEAARRSHQPPPANPDDPVNADPGVVNRVRARLAEACAAIDARIPAGARGADGHWHGGPDPCPVCGAAPPYRRA